MKTIASSIKVEKHERNQKHYNMVKRQEQNEHSTFKVAPKCFVNFQHTANFSLNANVEKIEVFRGCAEWLRGNVEFKSNHSVSLRAIRNEKLR